MQLGLRRNGFSNTDSCISGDTCNQECLVRNDPERMVKFQENVSEFRPCTLGRTVAGPELSVLDQGHEIGDHILDFTCVVDGSAIVLGGDTVQPIAPEIGRHDSLRVQKLRLDQA